CARDAVDFW
nr:immunoglobulin heavy chain junction region [Mus musculus]